MRIAIVGPHKDEAISKAEQVFHVEVKHPWKEEIIDCAAETYKYLDENDVIFEGSPFDFLAGDSLEGYDDVYEQICLNSLENVDYIAVIAMDMDRRQLKIYKEYQKLFPEKFYIYSSPVEFEIRMN